jgi:endonuclease/exonuclease/phosphatase family metal-dependent hydrolase
MRIEMSKDKITMKLICLNTAGGFVKNELHAFITKHAADTDIFCFQEIFDNAHVTTLGDIDQNLYTTITELLPNHKGYYAPSQENDEGIAMFIKPTIKLDALGDVFVHRYLNAMEDKERRTLGRNLQYVQFTQNGQDYTVINVHGLWNGAGKKDTPDRLKQSRKIKDFIKTRAKGKVILIGDLNLEPDTKSLAILEAGMRNLIKENDITSTRSHYHKWPNKFADYALVSNDLQVIHFEVLQDQVSDHLPLLLEFS